MSDNVRLAPVVRIGVPELGHIFAEAFHDDLLRLFTFKHGPDLALSITNNQARFQMAYNNTSRRFLKLLMGRLEGSWASFNGQRLGIGKMTQSLYSHHRLTHNSTTQSLAD